jgi:hypothetical protein
MLGRVGKVFLSSVRHGRALHVILPLFTVGGFWGGLVLFAAMSHSHLVLWTSVEWSPGSKWGLGEACWVRGKTQCVRNGLSAAFTVLNSFG